MVIARFVDELIEQLACGKVMCARLSVGSWHHSMMQPAWCSYLHCRGGHGRTGKLPCTVTRAFRCLRLSSYSLSPTDRPGMECFALLSGTVAAILLARLYTLTADDALRYVQLFHDTRQQARASYRALSPATQ